MTYTKEIIIYLQQKTGINLTDFLFDFFEFFSNDYPLLVDFYSGKSDKINPDVFNRYALLKQGAKGIESKMLINVSRFNNILDYEIIDSFGDLIIEINAVQALPKFLKSNKTLYQFNSNLEFEVGLKQSNIEQNIEQILGVSDAQNSWAEVAERNDLSEIEYRPEDGTLLVLSYQFQTKTTPITTVVDVINTSTILGKDVKKRMAWKDDDLEVLTVEETFEQTCDILLNLIVGDVPEFPNFGRSVFPGSNMKLFSYPALKRNLTQTLSTDDTIQKFNLKNVKVVDADISFDVEVFSRIEEVKLKNIII